MADREMFLPDELTLIVGSRKFSGWDSIRVTRGRHAHRMPFDFSLSMTERYSSEADFIVQPGDPCMVMVGADIVLTGYVDCAAINGEIHSVTLAGQGKCCDLVDCSAIVQFLR